MISLFLGTWVSRFFRQYYGPFIIHPMTRVVAIITWMLYVIGAIVGLFYIREGLNPQNLVPKDHYIYDFFEHSTDFYNVGPQLHVLVESPPDIVTWEGRQR